MKNRTRSARKKNGMAKPAELTDKEWRELNEERDKQLDQYSEGLYQFMRSELEARGELEPKQKRSARKTAAKAKPKAPRVVGKRRGR